MAQFSMMFVRVNLFIHPLATPHFYQNVEQLNACYEGCVIKRETSNKTLIIRQVIKILSKKIHAILSYVTQTDVEC